MSENDHKKEMIEQAVEAQGFTVQSWDEDEDGLRANLGRFVASYDGADDAYFVGDEGDLTVSVVGAQKHNNERVYFGFQPEGTDSAWEVHDLTDLDPA